MTIYRKTPVCPYCGKPVAIAITENQDNIPFFMQKIGDNFIRWEYKECNCKKSKAERRRRDKLPKLDIKEWLTTGKIKYIK